MSEDAPKPQADKFKDMAREVQADQGEAAFMEAARKIARAPSQKVPRGQKGRS